MGSRCSRARGHPPAMCGEQHHAAAEHRVVQALRRHQQHAWQGKELHTQVGGEVLVLVVTQA